jgi:hypothetical protein
MPINVCWDDAAQTIIRLDVRPYTWEEFHSAFEEAFALAQTVPYRVDFIIDAPPTIHTPTPNYLPHLQLVFADVPANAGMFVLAGGSAFGKLIVSLFIDVVGWHKRARLVASVAAARDLVARAREAVPGA